MTAKIESPADGLLLGLWRIEETSAELRALLNFPVMYADRIAPLRENSARMREILAVRCLLKAMTGEEQRVLYDADGSPAIPQQIESVRQSDGKEVHTVWTHLSISHTEGWAAVLLASRPVGIDIERLGRRVERVTSRFLQESELALLRDEVELHLAWSAKESLYKVLGRDYFDLQHLTTIEAVNYTSREGNLRRGTMDVTVSRQGLKTLHFETNSDFVLTCLF